MFSEQDVDRELKAALSVAPSPDFEARVLQRVGADRPSRWAHYGWLAAAASLVMVAGGFYAMNRTSGDVAPPPAQVVEQAPSRGIVGTVREPPSSPLDVRQNPADPPRVQAVRTQRSAARIGVRSPSQIARRLAETEVIVPPNQMEAVRRLVREINNGRLIEAPAEPRPGPMAPPATLGVAPVVVEPIPLSPLAPGVETATPFIRGLK